jgi:hypothetical protein
MSALPVLREMSKLVEMDNDNRDLPIPEILPLVARTTYSGDLVAQLYHS